MINSLLAEPAVAAELNGMPGVDPSWSRLSKPSTAKGCCATWHVSTMTSHHRRNAALCARQPDLVVSVAPISGLCRLRLASRRGDQLGMGYPSARPAGVPLRRDRRLDAVTAELGLAGRVVLAAHDWGGPISLGWALRHLDQIAGLILTNTGVGVPPPTATPTLIRLARSPALRELVCVRTPTFVRAAATLSRPPIPVEVRAALRAPYSGADRRRAVGDFVADIPLEPSHPSRPVLDQVAARLTELATVPTLLLWGPRDPVFTQTSLRDLQVRLPHADLHRYAQASHLVVEDAPQSAEDAWSWVRAKVTTTWPSVGATGRRPSGSGSGLLVSRQCPAWQRLRSGIASCAAAAPASHPSPTSETGRRLARAASSRRTPDIESRCWCLRVSI